LLPKELAFTPDFRPGYDYTFSRVASFTYDLKAPPSKIDVEFISHDWVVLTLEKNLPQKPIPVRPIDANWVNDINAVNLISGGYSFDRPYLLSVDYGCNLKAQAAKGSVLVTDCDSTKGNSGSPVLLRHGQDDWYVVGVFSAAAQQGSPEMATFAVSAEVFFGRY
jgi:protease YdgD